MYITNTANISHCIKFIWPPVRWPNAASKSHPSAATASTFIIVSLGQVGSAWVIRPISSYKVGWQSKKLQLSASTVGGRIYISSGNSTKLERGLRRSVIKTMNIPS